MGEETAGVDVSAEGVYDTVFSDSEKGSMSVVCLLGDSGNPHLQEVCRCIYPREERDDKGVDGRAKS